MSATSHLWVLIHKHQSEIQALGPFATLGAAIIAAGVAGTFGWLQYRVGLDQRHIAASQRDIAKMRVRMDLHDKRYEVATAAHDLMHVAFSGEFDHAGFHKLRQIMKQGQFFFPSNIAAYIETLDTACLQEFTFGSVRNPSTETLDALHAATLRVAEHMQRWPVPFSEVMTFRDVD